MAGVRPRRGRQAAITNMLENLQRDCGIAYLFVAHDLSVIRHTSTRVAVMYLGKLVELTPWAEIFDAPQHTHHYTAALLGRRYRRWRGRPRSDEPSW